MVFLHEKVIALGKESHASFFQIIYIVTLAKHSCSFSLLLRLCFPSIIKTKCLLSFMGSYTSLINGKDSLFCRNMSIVIWLVCWNQLSFLHRYTIEDMLSIPFPCSKRDKEINWQLVNSTLLRHALDENNQMDSENRNKTSSLTINNRSKRMGM